MGPSCRPTSTKASALSTNTVVSQTAYDGSRMRAGVRMGATRAIPIA